MNRRSSFVTGSVLFLCLLFPACGRHRLRHDEVERNRLFAAIVEREDRRMLGNDDFFQRNLQSSPYPEVREWCALALARIGSPRALPWLYDALRSSYAGVRAAAAFAVGKIEDRDALKQEYRQPDSRAALELEKLLADPAPQVRIRAMEALGRAGSSPQAIRIALQLAASTDDGSPQQRVLFDAGITALLRLKEPNTYAVIEKLADSSDPEIQWRALNALVRVGDRTARPIFVRLLNSRHPNVRYYAARGIGICEDPQLSGLLLPLLAPHESGNGKSLPLPVRAAALQALGTLKCANCIPAIRAALVASPISQDYPDQVNFAIQAAAALGNIGSEEAEGILTSLLKMQGPVADSAVIALAKILRAQPDRFFVNVRGVEFADSPAARAWARALGELGGERAILELKSALVRSVEDHARYADVQAVPSVLEALAKAGATDMDQILQPYLASHDSVVLRAALAAYKPGSGVRSPWAPIVQAYAAVAPLTDVETKVAVLDRLEPWIREPEVQSTLRSALQDRERNARIAAERLLRMADAADVPEDPGPSEVSATPQTYEMVAAARKDRTVAILETTRGDIEIELFMEDAPLTAANFIWLAKRSFYNGLSFMRVVPNFVIQGGDPRNDQEGGPGYSIRCEINMRPYERGSVGMALAGKDTGGSQFFITMSAQPHLDGGYTCFGRVISGMPSVDHMVPGDRIIKVRIEEDITALDYRRY
jgi:cyclophilin family peptidyl-prolyl cis-trans isomerase/HEAT repeat protein